MPVSVSEYLNIDSATLDAVGAFDAVLDVDSALFIDPRLLEAAKEEHIRGAYIDVSERFSNIIRVLKQSQSEGDAHWRAAQRLFPMGELTGLCIGYSTTSDGSGVGPVLRDRVLKTAKEIIRGGSEDPRIFELVPLFEKDFGSDLISDMISVIIKGNIAAYTESVLSRLGVTTGLSPMKIGDKEYMLSRFGPKNAPILLLPRSILRDLPIARDWGEIDVVCQHNQEVRDQFESMIGATWKQVVSHQKDVIKEALLKEPELVKDLLQYYADKPATEYDYNTDNAAAYKWIRVAKEVVSEQPLELAGRDTTTANGVNQIVEEILSYFKQLVENGKIWKELYNESGKAKTEKTAQRLFYCVAWTVCKISDLDISPEPDAGRGQVDFKVSNGATKKVVVEMKLSKNSDLPHGYRTQIIEYIHAEQASHAHYVVVRVTGEGKQQIPKLDAAIKSMGTTEKVVPQVTIINGFPRDSASVVKEDSRN